MKLLQTSYDENFHRTLKDWMDQIHGSNTAALFHIYVPYNKESLRRKLEEVRLIIRLNAPSVPVIGCTATGEILDGQMVDEQMVITLMVFEEPTTKIEVLPYYEKTREIDPKWLLEHARNIPDLKGIEILTSASYEKLEYTGQIIDNLPEDIEVFGGVAVGDEYNPPYVFANDGKCSNDGSAAIFYSGPELYIQTNRMFGWKPIGYPLKVTKAQGPVVYELDGKPAYDVYNHYLRIRNDHTFFYNALEFPWEVRVDEETAYIRHAKSVNSDGSILMSSNIPQGSDVRLTFGDPRRIMEHTKQVGIQIHDFAPQVVHIINCMGRKLFWGGKEKIEIAEISQHLKTTGFSALGEVMRYKGTTLLNNLSIITVAMREGPKGDVSDIDLEQFEKRSNISITARLAIFINTMTEELMQKNLQLNEMLYKASHDALTGLYNRGAIERIIYEGADEAKDARADWYLIMFDIDNFKMINDEHGHAKGDRILKLVADVLGEYVETLEGVETGRWGGEEFMLFVKGRSPEDVKEIAENISARIKSSSTSFGTITVSVGVTKHRSDQDVLETINRVDEQMYLAKNQGKDRVCSDL